MPDLAIPPFPPNFRNAALHSMLYTLVWRDFGARMTLQGVRLSSRVIEAEVQENPLIERQPQEKMKTPKTKPRLNGLGKMHRV